MDRRWGWFHVPLPPPFRCLSSCSVACFFRRFVCSALQLPRRPQFSHGLRVCEAKLFCFLEDRPTEWQFLKFQTGSICHLMMLANILAQVGTMNRRRSQIVTTTNLSARVLLSEFILRQHTCV